MRRAKLAAALALVAIAGTVAVATVLAHDGPTRPREMLVAAHGLMVRTTSGTYCVVDERVAQCADSVYALRVRGRLPVEPGDRVTLFARDRRIRRLGVSLIRAEGNDWGDEYEYVGWRARAHRVPERPSRWRFRLPADLREANRLDISIRYGNGVGGDANFWAGLDPRGSGTP